MNAPEDRFICSAWNEAAIVAGMNDRDAALDFVRKFVSFEGKLKLTAVGVQPTGAAVFVGRPIISKFTGRCAVCSLGFAVGAEVLHDPEQKRAAHLRCGEVG
jgi:hypothetical protein